MNCKICEQKISSGVPKLKDMCKVYIDIFSKYGYYDSDGELKLSEKGTQKLFTHLFA